MTQREKLSLQQSPPASPEQPWAEFDAVKTSIQADLKKKQFNNRAWP